MIQTLSLPFHTTRLNQLIGCHWSKVSRLKKADRNAVGLMARQQGIEEATGKRRVTLTVVMGPRQRTCDPDAFWKVLLDSLVACGALVEDNKENVELAPVVYARSDSASMRIELEDV